MIGARSAFGFLRRVSGAWSGAYSSSDIELEIERVGDKLRMRPARRRMGDVLDVALCGEAQAIVTGDKDLLILHPFHGVPIWAPAEFLAF